MNIEIEKKALDTCDGVIVMAQAEMLRQGVYVTRDIIDRERERDGSICGGRQACLVGSIFLAYGVPWGDIDFEGHIPSFFSAENRESYMADKPALELAYTAFNQAAFEIVEREYGERLDYDYDWDEDKDCYMPTDRLEVPPEGWGEYFFEKVLGDEGSRETVQLEVIRLANRAKELIQSGLVVTV